LVCTKLKTKFKSYASFHISVTEDEFSVINNIGVWPYGCLIAPYYGKLTPDQIFTPSTPEVGAAAAATKLQQIQQVMLVLMEAALHPFNMAYFSDANIGRSDMSHANFGNSLGIYYQNIRDLKTKQTEFYNVRASNFDIFCLSETWLNDLRYNHNLFVTVIPFTGLTGHI
jgi:hypothetical protein